MSIISTMADSPNSQRNDPIWDITAHGEDMSEERSSADTSTTPASEISPPGSPARKNAPLIKSEPKAKSRNLAASLSLEEQVRYAPSISILLELR